MSSANQNPRNRKKKGSGLRRWHTGVEGTGGPVFEGATLLIFANKQDLPGALSASEIRDFLGLDEIAYTSLGLFFFLCR